MTTTVEEIMRRDVALVHPYDSIVKAWRLILEHRLSDPGDAPGERETTLRRAHGVDVLVVVSGGLVAGLVTRAEIEPAIPV